MSRYYLYVLVLCSFVMLIFASDARQIVMGRNYILDDNDIIYNPAYALDYPDFIRMELKYYAAYSAWGILNTRINDDWVLGAHFNREDGAIYSMTSSYVEGPINGLGVYAATRLGEIQYGLEIYFAQKKELETSDDAYDSGSSYGHISKTHL